MKRGTCICGEIVDELPLAQATVSQHLKVLKEAGLITGQVEGSAVCYCIAPTPYHRCLEISPSWRRRRAMIENVA